MHVTLIAQSCLAELQISTDRNVTHTHKFGRARSKRGSKGKVRKCVEHKHYAYIDICMPYILPLFFYVI